MNDSRAALLQGKAALRSKRRPVAPLLEPISASAGPSSPAVDLGDDGEQQPAAAEPASPDDVPEAPTTRDVVTPAAVVKAPTPKARAPPQMAAAAEVEAARNSEAEASRTKLRHGDVLRCARLHAACGGTEWKRQFGWPGSGVVPRHDYASHVEDGEVVGAARTVDGDMDMYRGDGIFLDGVTGASRVITLDLSHNDVIGRLPESVCSFDKLTVLNVAGNRLAGPLPSRLGNLHVLRELYVYQNKLTGTSPSRRGVVRPAPLTPPPHRPDPAERRHWPRCSGDVLRVREERRCPCYCARVLLLLLLRRPTTAPTPLQYSTAATTTLLLLD